MNSRIPVFDAAVFRLEIKLNNGFAGITTSEKML